jgi:predicted nucleic acid-binding protein
VTAAYLDTSCLIAVAFDEPGARGIGEELEDFDALLSSNLLEAELRAAFVREGVEDGSLLLTWLTWVLPDRSLGPEIASVLRAGYLRGADAWHLATALYLAETPADLPFLTLDARQQQIAAALGFPTPLRDSASG